MGINLDDSIPVRHSLRALRPGQCRYFGRHIGPFR